MTRATSHLMLGFVYFSTYHVVVRKRLTRQCFFLHGHQYRAHSLLLPRRRCEIDQVFADAPFQGLRRGGQTFLSCFGE